MSERGIIVTDPIYNDKIRAAVLEYVKSWPKGSALVCLSICAAPGGSYAGCEKEDAEELALFISDLMRSLPETEISPDVVIKVHCVPDSADPCVFIASRYVRRDVCEPKTKPPIKSYAKKTKSA
jgi:hypothetical protein